MAFIVACVALLVFLGVSFGYGASLTLIAITTAIFLVFLFFFYSDFIMSHGGYFEFLVRASFSLIVLCASGSIVVGLWIGWFLHYFNVRVVLGG
ncbi:MAG: hypothetical protein HZA36_01255 [Parcubacteria group bacterium]|nr:hypothetical protein [Parcubacteria group bacterium]